MLFQDFSETTQIRVVNDHCLQAHIMTSPLPNIVKTTQSVTLVVGCIIIQSDLSICQSRKTSTGNFDFCPLFNDFNILQLKSQNANCIVN